MAERFVRIVHKDGREYAIQPKDFDVKNVSPEGESYADQGYRIVAWEDGTEYDGPKSRREIDAAKEERAAQRAERQAQRDEPKPEPKRE